MKKHLISKILCLALAAITLFALTGCGSSQNSEPNVEGVWLAVDEDGEETGYALHPLTETVIGTEAGPAYLRPSRNLYFAYLYYTYLSDTEIEIRKRTYLDDKEDLGDLYDTLRIENENGQRVLVSTETGTKYYYSCPLEEY